MAVLGRPRQRLGGPDAPKSVVVCGIDGSGKTSVAAGLADAVAERAGRAKVIRLLDTHADPAERLFRLQPHLKTQSFCDAVALCRQLALSTIVDAVASRPFTHWIFDRYVYTDLAYPMAHGVDMTFIRALLRETPSPDLAILLDLPATVAMERIQRRGGAWAFQENLGVLDRARSAYLEIAEEEGFHVVDGALSQAEVMRNVLKVLNLDDDQLCQASAKIVQGGGVVRG